MIFIADKCHCELGKSNPPMTIDNCFKSVWKIGLKFQLACSILHIYMYTCTVCNITGAYGVQCSYWYLQVLLMLAIVGIISILTWFPYAIWVLVVVSFPAGKRLQVLKDSELYRRVFFVLPLTNCFTTPLIYLVFNKDFKVNTLFLIAQYSKFLI